jgi:hypothetical protein
MFVERNWYARRFSRGCMLGQSAHEKPLAADAAKGFKASEIN